MLLILTTQMVYLLRRCNLLAKGSNTVALQNRLLCLYYFVEIVHYIHETALYRLNDCTICKMTCKRADNVLEISAYIRGLSLLGLKPKDIH